MKFMEGGRVELSDEELEECWLRGQDLACKIGDILREDFLERGFVMGRFKDAALGVQTDYNAAIIVLAAVLARFADQRTRDGRTEMAMEMVKETTDAMMSMIDSGYLEATKLLPTREH